MKNLKGARGSANHKIPVFSAPLLKRHFENQKPQKERRGGILG